MQGILDYFSFFLTNTNFSNLFEISILLLLVIIFASFVILSINPIHSILFLILVFFTMSLVFIYSGALFLGMILIIVYLGAVCVLFLFVIMMLNIKTLELKRQINFIPYIVLSFILIFCFIFFKNIFNEFNFAQVNFLNESLININSLLQRSVILGFLESFVHDESVFSEDMLSTKYFEFFILLNNDTSLQFFKLDNYNKIIELLETGNKTYIEQFNVLDFSIQNQLDFWKHNFYSIIGNRTFFSLDHIFVFKKLSFVLYTVFFIHFLCAGVVLLIAMLGAIFLTLDTLQKSKNQNIFMQLNRMKFKV